MNQTPEEYVQENRDTLVNVLRHSSNEHARACAWAILNVGSEDPDIEQLERELQQLKEQRGMA